MKNGKSSATVKGLSGEDAAAVLDMIDGLRDEVRQLRDEVRSLKGQRDPAAMMSVDEAAGLAGIGKRTMNTMIAEGTVPSAKIGGRRLVPRKAFGAWLDRQIENG
jgi:excisionase family DNA binding protein